MDVRTDTIGSWEPTATEWGTTAYEETKIQFVELVLGSAEPRPQAFALWALSHDPSLEGEELMRFGGGCGHDRPSPDHIDKAIHALGISVTTRATTDVATHAPAPTHAPTSAPTQVPTAPARASSSAPVSDAAEDSASTTAKKAKKSGAKRASKQLSSMEKAILANFKDASKLIAAYKKAQTGLKKAESALEKAANALRDIDKDKAKLLAQFDAAAEAVLTELGILGDGGTGGW